MGGETEKEISGWTVDTLHIHLDQQFRDLRLQLDDKFKANRAQLDERFSSQQAMVKTALDSNEKRFESINEFRAQLGDQQRTFVTRSESDIRIAALGEKVDDLSRRITDLDLRVTSELKGTAGSQAATTRMIGVGIAIATIVIAIVSVLANVLTSAP